MHEGSLGVKCTLAVIGTGVTVTFDAIVAICSCVCKRSVLALPARGGRRGGRGRGGPPGPPCGGAAA
eukprot:8299320-Pyramimonas_sp.AAC.1